MIDLATASAFSKNASEMLGVLAFFGILMGVLRWQHALRRDFVVAWIVVMTGIFMTQLPVYIGGMTGWGAELVLLSGISRSVQIVGSALFARAVLWGECSPVVLVFVIGAAALAAAML